MTTEDKGRILIVDDELISVRSLTHHLAGEYEVLTACNGFEALERAETFRPDVILLDIVMPEMDGYEVFRRILNNPGLCDTPVLFITSMNEAECEAKGLELGAHDYLRKPYDPAIVRLRVKNHLKLKRNSDLVKEQRDLLAQKNRQLELFANHDVLTGLPNRALFTDRIERALSLSRRLANMLALFFIDLDRFKPINDEFGHEVGDWLLQEAAARMESCVRKSDTVARIGGDEFAVLLLDVKSVDNALNVAEKIRAAMNKPFLTPADKSLEISASIGVALYPDHGDNERDLLRYGDEAMYRVKKSGRNSVRLFEHGVPV